MEMLNVQNYMWEEIELIMSGTHSVNELSKYCCCTTLLGATNYEIHQLHPYHKALSIRERWHILAWEIFKQCDGF